MLSIGRLIEPKYMVSAVKTDGSPGNGSVIIEHYGKVVENGLGSLYRNDGKEIKIIENTPARTYTGAKMASWRLRKRHGVSIAINDPDML